MEPRPAEVNATTFSPCGSYLVCGTGLGKLHVWHITLHDGVDDSSDDTWERVATLDAHVRGCAIYSLVFAAGKGGEVMLLSGADEEIRGWRWADCLAAFKKAEKNKTPPAMPAPLLRLENPRTGLRRGALGQLSETCALAVDASAGLLYSAAGDGNAYAWDLTTQKCVATYGGGGEPLHCLTLCPKRKQLVTGGEDGCVRLWDVRTAQCDHVITPASLGDGARKGGSADGVSGGGGGGWCGCVAVDEAETWLVAGWGDGFLCSLDLNTRAVVACMPTAAAPLAAAFEPGSDFHIISIGAECGLYHWRITGELETRATCSSPTALGLAISHPSGGARTIAVGGSAGTVDIFRETSHRALTLNLHEE